MGVLDRIKTIEQLDVASRRVLVRVDFNVPLTPNGEVADDMRIREALPSIKLLLSKGARLVLASHRGHPSKDDRTSLSLEPAGLRLAELLGTEIVLADDCIGDGARRVVHDLREGRIVLLENLRFHPGEEANDEAFARELAKLADVYVSDSFGTSHRAHASIDALPRLVAVKGAGLLLEKELRAMDKLTGAPERPFVAVLGGERVGEMIGAVEALMTRVDAMLIGGTLANTFLAATGRSLGKSRVEADKLALARDVIDRAHAKKLAFVLPSDFEAGPAPAGSSRQTVGADAVPDELMAHDIGPRTIDEFRAKLLGAKTIFWNGLVGRMADGDGSASVARAIAEAACFSVVAGSESVAVVNKAGLAGRFAHISTGGRASLALLEGKKLPGVEALRS